jgi:hypothetical protein
MMSYVPPEVLLPLTKKECILLLLWAVSPLLQVVGLLMLLPLWVVLVMMLLWVVMVLLLQELLRLLLLLLLLVLLLVLGQASPALPSPLPCQACVMHTLAA